MDFFIIMPLVCHSDPIQHLVLTRYNRYRVSRIFKIFFCLKLLEMSQNMQKCEKKMGVLTWYRPNSLQKGHIHQKSQ